MQREPWELNDEQIHKLVVVGVAPERIEALNELRHESYQEMLLDTYGEDSIENAERHFYNKYGFDHLCHCVDDLFSEDTVTIPRCRYNMGEDALDALEARNIERDELADWVERLRIQVVSLGEDPIV